MKHYGDITKISGVTVEPVNVIIGGSPCQDLSVAGKQKGIKHTDNNDGETTRSGLFMEQLRIIKEMRCKDIEQGRTGISTRPRYMVWENVPGAFSSPKGNKGADFQTVLEETIKVVNEKAPAVPIPKDGWPNAGCFTDMGGKWSVAWRVFDAQFWGVPQRRKRIALVADFGGLAAPEILFEREGVFGDIEPGRQEGENSPAEIEGGVGAAIRAFCIQGNCIDRADTAGCNGKGWADGVCYTLNTVDRPAVAIFNPGELSRLPCSSHYWTDGICPTLRATGGDNRPAVMLKKDATAYGICSMASNSMNSSNPHRGIYEAQTARTLDLNGGNPSCNQGGIFILENHPHDSRIKISDDNVVQSLNARMGTGGNNTPLVLAPAAAYDCRNDIPNNELSGTLQSKDTGDHSLNYINPVFVNQNTQYIVRRLTPLECERLQGFPDNWTDIGEWVDGNGKKRPDSNDSARYKAIGNSIALPPWVYVLQRLSLCCGSDVTMASLFDGMGGFPLIWEQLNGIGTCLWASEIEDFPIAVTKRRFKREDK